MVLLYGNGAFHAILGVHAIQHWLVTLQASPLWHANKSFDIVFQTGAERQSLSLHQITRLQVEIALSFVQHLTAGVLVFIPMVRALSWTFRSATIFAPTSLAGSYAASGRVSADLSSTHRSLKVIVTPDAAHHPVTTRARP